MVNIHENIASNRVTLSRSTAHEPFAYATPWYLQASQRIGMSVHDEIMRRTWRAYMLGDGRMTQAGECIGSIPEENCMVAFAPPAAKHVILNYGQGLLTAASLDAPKCPVRSIGVVAQAW